MFKSVVCLIVTAGLFLGGVALPAAGAETSDDSTEQLVGKGGGKGKKKGGKTEEI